MWAAKFSFDELRGGGGKKIEVLRIILFSSFPFCTDSTDQILILTQESSILLTAHLIRSYKGCRGLW